MTYIFFFPVVEFQSCCRLPGILNAKENNYGQKLKVTVKSLLQSLISVPSSPIPTIPPILQLPIGDVRIGFFFIDCFFFLIFFFFRYKLLISLLSMLIAIHILADLPLPMKHSIPSLFHPSILVLMSIFYPFPLPVK